MNVTNMCFVTKIGNPNMYLSKVWFLCYFKIDEIILNVIMEFKLR